MFDFSHYYGRHKQYKTNVLKKDVIRKGKTLQIRINAELEKDLVELAKELGQNESKVARDILTDFFLEKHTRDWEKEVKEL